MGWRRAVLGSTCPSREGRVVAGVPRRSQARCAQVPVGADLPGHGAEVMPQVGDRWTPPEPVPVVDAVDDEAGLEHEGVGDHRVVARVGVLLDVQVLLDGSTRVGEKVPLRPDRGAELLQCVVVVRGDRGDAGIRHGDLGIRGGELEVLLVLLGAVEAAREREDERVVAVQLAQSAGDAGVVRQLVVLERAAGVMSERMGALSRCGA
jgi:hypothetical protein